MTRRVLVTGGAGFLGSALARRLVRDGAKVRVLDNVSRGQWQRLSDVDVEAVEADIRDPEVVGSACAGVHTIYHLAAVNGTRFFYSMPYLVLEVGIRGMLNVLEGASRHGAREILLASSSEVYQTAPRVPTGEDVPMSIPDPLNARYSYAGSKVASELLLLNFGRDRDVRVVVVRPHNVYGPDMGEEHVIPELTRRIFRLSSERPAGVLPVEIQGSGDETRAFCFVDDAVEGIVTLARGGEHRGVYNVGTDEEVPIAQLARMIGSLAGREIEVVSGPPAAGGTTRRCPDISKLRALGYVPRTPLRDGLAQTVRWYREHERLPHRAAHVS